MQFLSRFDIIDLMMRPTFWIGVATVIIVTLLVYWPGATSIPPQTGCALC